MNEIMLGFDLHTYILDGVKIPLIAPIGHLICVGGSGSGKSTGVLYWVLKTRSLNIHYTILDFKASHEFEGITEDYAEFEGS